MKKALLSLGFVMSSIFIANAQFTSFETSEGFTLGNINGQNNWSVTTLMGAKAAVSNGRAMTGVNSLRISPENSQSTNLHFAYSPIYPIDAESVTVSQDIYIDPQPATGFASDTYIDVLEYDSTGEGTLYLTSRLVFDYNNKIQVISGINAAGTAYEYEELISYNRSTWYNVKIVYDVVGGSMNYYLNGSLIYSNDMYNGVYADVVRYGFDDYGSGFNIDNFRLENTLSNENFTTNIFNISPNPTSDIVNISSSLNTNLTQVNVIDLNGRTVKAFNLGGVVNAQINIADLSSGVYMLNITSEEGTTTKKIVKN